jgi:hypothetical protein
MRTADEEDGAESAIEAKKDDDDHNEFKQGKEPMSPELFCKVCSWLIAWGMGDAMFALCSFVHTWNLACQGHNTARIRLSHMTGSTFDSTQRNFKHTKTDKLGGGKQQKRSICINHVYMLVLYVATAFTKNQSRGQKLFPGSAISQSSRAAKILKRVLKEHADKVL